MLNVFGTGLMLLCAFAFWSIAEPEFTILHALLWLIVLFAGLEIAIVLHELGHLAAGTLAGFRWRAFKAGPLLLMRVGGSVRLTLAKPHGCKGHGLVVAEDCGVRSTDLRTLIMLAGGPIASLLTASIGLVYFIETITAPAGIRFAIGLFSACSTAVLATSIVPATSSGHLSDGGKILRLIRGPNRDQEKRFWRT